MLKLTNLLITALSGLFVILILGLALRGSWGNPTSQDLNSTAWRDEGPLELSPERGRLALTYSVVEDKSVFFSIPVARFATPDVAQANGHFVSLFAPTVSFIIIPGYALGKMIGASQLGSYAVISLFAVANFFLIRSLVKQLANSTWAGTAAGLIFVFASPAFAYAVSLYQHHISTFVLLSCLYLLRRSTQLWSVAIIWSLCALAISIDNPNLFLLFPVGVYSLSRVAYFTEQKTKVTLNLKLAAILALIPMCVPLGLFLYFNNITYGSPFKLGGTATSAIVISETGQVDISDLAKKNQSTTEATQNKSAIGFFNTRYLPNGLYTHLLSPDRGVPVYAPVILLGIFGLIILAKKDSGFTGLLVAVIGVNVLLYSMWGDPYGGWAFGSRYLIPSYAVLSVALGVALAHWRHKIWFSLLVLLIAGYSVTVNTIGAVTTNRLPPKVEVLGLEAITGQRERYTFTRNMEMLYRNQTKSFVYNAWVKHYQTAWEYTLTLSTAITIALAISLICLSFEKKPRHES